MSQKKHSILFISNSSQIGGAPLLFLEFLQWFKKYSYHNFIILLPFDGILADEFKKIAPTYISNFYHDNSKNILIKFINKIFKKFNKPLWQHRHLIREFKRRNINLIYSNTVHNDYILNYINKRLNIKTIIHAHEMNYVMNVEDRRGVSLRKSITNAEKIIAVSNSTKNTLISRYSIHEDKINITLNGIDFNKFSKIGTKKAKEFLSFSPKDTIVLGVGQPHWIKGIDIFIQVAIQTHNQIKNIKFVWLGGDEKNYNYLDFIYEIDKLQANSYIQIHPNTLEPSVFFEAADIFLMCSREESFSLVTLEAGYFSKPIICFDKSGGPAEIIKDNGFVADYLNINQVVDKIIYWHTFPDKATEIGNKFNEIVLAEYEQSRMFNQILKQINE